MEMFSKNELFMAVLLRSYLTGMPTKDFCNEVIELWRQMREVEFQNPGPKVQLYELYDAIQSVCYMYNEDCEIEYSIGEDELKSEIKTYYQNVQNIIKSLSSDYVSKV